MMSSCLFYFIKYIFSWRKIKYLINIFSWRIIFIFIKINILSLNKKYNLYFYSRQHVAIDLTSMIDENSRCWRCPEKIDLFFGRPFPPSENLRYIHGKIITFSRPSGCSLADAAFPLISGFSVWPSENASETPKSWNMGEKVNYRRNGCFRPESPENRNKWKKPLFRGSGSQSTGKTPFLTLSKKRAKTPKKRVRIPRGWAEFGGFWDDFSRPQKEGVFGRKPLFSPPMSRKPIFPFQTPKNPFFPLSREKWAFRVLWRVFKNSREKRYFRPQSTENPLFLDCMRGTLVGRKWGKNNTFSSIFPLAMSGDSEWPPVTWCRSPEFWCQRSLAHPSTISWSFIMISRSFFSLW